MIVMSEVGADHEHMKPLLVDDSEVADRPRGCRDGERSVAVGTDGRQRLPRGVSISTLYSSAVCGLGGHQRHPADRARPGRGRADIRMHRADERRACVRPPPGLAPPASGSLDAAHAGAQADDAPRYPRLLAIPSLVGRSGARLEVYHGHSADPVIGRTFRAGEYTPLA